MTDDEHSSEPESKPRVPCWIALVEVSPRPGCQILDGGRGAFAHFIARCKGRDGLLERLARRCDEELLDAVHIAWVQDADKLAAEERLARDIRDLMGYPELCASGTFVGFHTWETDDDEDESDVA